MEKFNLKEEMLKAPIAHRGYFNDEFPENSTAAMERAVANNFSIELDIQLTKDDVVVVFHDNDLKRMTGVDKMVKDLTYQEILELRLKDTSYQVPTFEEILKIVDGKVFLVIELKTISGKNETLVNKTVEILRNYKGKFVVQSFDPTIVQKFRKKAPEFIRGQLVGSMNEAPYSKFLKFALENIYLNILSKPSFVNTHFNHYPRRIKNWQKRGKLLICYTPRNLEEYKYCLDKYDAAIFEGFDPVEIFQANKLNKK